ncbi:MAG: hypothetical protein ACP5J4_15895 [Anaerolineae bacterium]
MSAEQALRSNVHAGEIVKPWLILGPFYEDLSAQVQGLTLFEKAGATVGRTAMDDIVAEARAVLTSMPSESEAASFRGQTGRWSLVRRPEEYLSWGTYNIANHLGAAFLTTCIMPEQPGVRQWRLFFDTTQRVIVAINGAVVYDTYEQSPTREHGFHAYTFAAALDAGENVVTVALFRLGRMARVGCRLEVLDGDLDARTPLPGGMSPDVRARIEAEVGGLRLDRDLFYPHHSIGVHFDVAPASVIHVSLLSEKGELLRETSANDAGFVALCDGTALADGNYQLVATWMPQERPLTSVTFDIKKVTPAEAPAGYESLDVRRRLVLEHYATNEERRSAWGIWNQVARYALRYKDPSGLPNPEVPEVDEDNIRETCEFIAARKDCADFVIQGLLRIMVWEREHRRLSPQINALMKDTVLGFKYWVDEPGDTVMYMGSENHRLLFHVAEWLAGQLFPTEEFTNSRQRGLYHATKGRTYITEWLRQRGRFGFDEWHSNSYFPVNIAPLINVYDFAIYEDYKLRQMAGAVLDAMFFILAADTLHGVFGTTHGRSYGINLKYPDFEGTSPTCWLLYGTGALSKGSSGMSPVSVATSVYHLPKLLAGIATDDQAVVESRQRHGILRGTAPHADFCVYRTPDYLLSGLQDHRKGEYESSTHVGQVTLGRKDGEQQAVIFWSAPLTCGEGSGLRPDYWSGHITLPRVVHHRNVMALTWRLASPFAWMTHCFFEQARFDEVRFDGKWAFARVGQGYAAIYSQNGFEVGDFGQYAGRELVCRARENTWLVECGRAADWGSFEAFVAALTKAEIEDLEDALVYHSPSIGEFVTGWDVAPAVGGEPLKLHGYPLVDSPWATSAFGSGEMTLRYGDETYDIWFNQ